MAVQNEIRLTPGNPNQIELQDANTILLGEAGGVPLPEDFDPEAENVIGGASVPELVGGASVPSFIGGGSLPRSLT